MSSKIRSEIHLNGNATRRFVSFVVLDRGPPGTMGGEGSESAESGSTDQVGLRHASISEEFRFASESIDGSDIEVRDDSESEYLYICTCFGFTLVSVMGGTEGKYITKVCGLDILVPLLLLCIFMLHVRVLAELMVIVFWVFVFLRYAGEKKGEVSKTVNRRSKFTSTKGENDTAESVEKKKRGDTGDGAKNPKVKNDRVSNTHSGRKASSLRRRVAKSEIEGNYESDDGEVIEVLGGF